MLSASSSSPETSSSVSMLYQFQRLRRRPRHLRLHQIRRHSRHLRLYQCCINFSVFVVTRVIFVCINAVSLSASLSSPETSSSVSMLYQFQRLCRHPRHLRLYQCCITLSVFVVTRDIFVCINAVSLSASSSSTESSSSVSIRYQFQRLRRHPKYFRLYQCCISFSVFVVTRDIIVFINAVSVSASSSSPETFSSVSVLYHFQRLRRHQSNLRLYQCCITFSVFVVTRDIVCINALSLSASSSSSVTSSVSMLYHFLRLRSHPRHLRLYQCCITFSVFVVTRIIVCINVVSLSASSSSHEISSVSMLYQFQPRPFHLYQCCITFSVFVVTRVISVYINAVSLSASSSSPETSSVSMLYLFQRLRRHP